MKITRNRAAVIYEILEEEKERRREEADEIPIDIEAVPRITRWERESVLLDESNKLVNP